MIKKLRNVPDGQAFILKRTGERYLMLRREIKTPFGTRIVVKRPDCQESSLHHSCHVILHDE